MSSRLIFRTLTTPAIIFTIHIIVKRHAYLFSTELPQIIIVVPTCTHLSWNKELISNPSMIVIKFL